MIQDEILDILVKHSKDPYSGYIDPNFLNGLNTLLYEYFQLENDDVDVWISDMFGQ